MTHISPEGLETLIAEMAEKYQKSPDEIRGILTPEALIKFGYQMQESTPLVEQIGRGGVRVREDMVADGLKSKGLG